MTGANTYFTLSGKHCISRDFVVRNIASEHLWDKWVKEANKGNFVRQRGGNGRLAGLELNAIPEKYKVKIVDILGKPEVVANPIEDHFSIDGAARMWFDGFKFADGTSLKPEQVNRYTINASVLNALAKLKKARETEHKIKGNPIGNLWPALINEVSSFNNTLKLKFGGLQHDLPKSEKLRIKLGTYIKNGYSTLVDGRNKNQAAKKVTPMMIALWNDIFSGQRHKPTYLEVAFKYNQFLNGVIEILNTDTGEVYDAKHEDFRPIDESTVYNYISAWTSRIATHAKRSGDRQVFKGKYEPYHKLTQPKYAGSIISIDDRQPPFAYDAGKRMWFYNAIDLGSEAFTCWVYGETKEGIITEFYRQLVRNYAEWNLNMPYEIECESSLNSSFKETFLMPGAMFSEVRIEANNARGKRIEAYYRALRYSYEKQREGWLARPKVLSESNLAGPGVVPFKSKEAIVDGCLIDIETWNNTLHSNQELHPGLTRWEVFMEKQHPELQPTNWRGILPHLGYSTKSSMKAGRITLQGMHRVVGVNGEVALGEKLINIMSQIEGEDVTLYWLDDNEGNVLKAHVYDNAGAFVCELLDDLSYSRSKLESGASDVDKRAIMSAYTATVQGYVSRNVKQLSDVVIIEKQVETVKKFTIKRLGSDRATASAIKMNEDFEAERLPELPNEDFNDDLNSIETGFNVNTKSRF